MKIQNVLLFPFLISILISCGAQKNNTTKNEINASSNIHPIIESVDFYAYAADSSWHLSIQMDEKIYFSDVANKRAQIFVMKDKMVASGANIIHLMGENEKSVIKVTIDIMECQKNGKKVDIMIRDKKNDKSIDYSGCGFYRGTPQLHDIWALHKINDSIISPSAFPGEYPHFEINLNNHTITGFAGCNRIFGKIFFAYEEMIIQQLVSTRMYCGEFSKLESNIVDILNDTPHYSIQNLLLTIESPKGTLVLKKID